MNVHRVFYPVVALGPGRRIGIWLQGCPGTCEGCMSPEMKIPDPSFEMDENLLFASLADIFARNRVDGVTISGGEPAMQWDALLRLLDFLAGYTKDILLYTGYTREELERAGRFAPLRSRTSVLVTGPYEAEKNDGLPLRGSSNQEILFSDGVIPDEYLRLLAGPRIVQPVETSSSPFIIGIMG